MINPIKRYERVRDILFQSLALLHCRYLGCDTSFYMVAKMSISTWLSGLELDRIYLCKPGKLRDLPVHPIASLYPMLPREKLESMADSLRTDRGQIHPVIILRTKTGHMILDGRNRIEACLLAKMDVKIKIVELNEEQAHAMINSVNNQRRAMNCREIAEVAWRYIKSFQSRSERPPTQSQVAKMFGISLRVMQKWKPGGQAIEGHQKRVKGRTFSIPYLYRPLAAKLCALMERKCNPKLDREEIDALEAAIEEQYAKLMAS